MSLHAYSSELWQGAEFRDFSTPGLHPSSLEASHPLGILDSQSKCHSCLSSWPSLWPLQFSLSDLPSSPTIWSGKKSGILLFSLSDSGFQVLGGKCVKMGSVGGLLDAWACKDKGILGGISLKAMTWSVSCWQVCFLHQSGSWLRLCPANPSHTVIAQG